MINYRNFSKDFLEVLMEFQKEYGLSYSLVDFIEFLNKKNSPDLKDERDFIDLKTWEDKEQKEQYDLDYRQNWYYEQNRI